jgi:ABC-type methionine transport system ATPase subunit
MIPTGLFFHPIGVILGPSGSGKSTLMNIIGGVDRADSGSVRVDGLKLLLCDEPTGALDYETSRGVLTLLEKVNRDSLPVKLNIAYMLLGFAVVLAATGSPKPCAAERWRASR